MYVTKDWVGGRTLESGRPRRPKADFWLPETRSPRIDARTRPAHTRASCCCVPDVESRESFRALLSAVLAAVKLEDLRGEIAVATPRGLRIARRVS